MVYGRPLPPRRDLDIPQQRSSAFSRSMREAVDPTPARPNNWRSPWNITPDQQSTRENGQSALRSSTNERAPQPVYLQPDAPSLFGNGTADSNAFGPVFQSGYSWTPGTTESKFPANSGLFQRVVEQANNISAQVLQGRDGSTAALKNSTLSSEEKENAGPMSGQYYRSNPGSQDSIRAGWSDAGQAASDHSARTKSRPAPDAQFAHAHDLDSALFLQGLRIDQRDPVRHFSPAPPVINNLAMMPIAPVYHPRRQAGQPVQGPIYHAHYGPTTYMPLETPYDEFQQKFKPLLKNKDKDKRPPLKAGYKYIVTACGDQDGSRWLQEQLATAHSDEREFVFNKIEPNMVPLMKDIYANYVIQKLLEYGTQVQKRRIVNIMKPHFMDLSMNMYSCRVVQAAFNFVLIEQQAELLAQIRESDMETLCQHVHGNHVIQQIIRMIPQDMTDPITKVFTCDGATPRYAKHGNACRVVQRLLEFAPPHVKAKMMTDLFPQVGVLVNDTFGNYVMQHIIEHGDPADRSWMIAFIRQNFDHYSRCKFASNVVEMVIQKCTVDERLEMMSELMANPARMEMLIRDPYGNYVIQSFMREEKLRGHVPLLFINSIRPIVASIRRTLTGTSKDKSGYNNTLTKLEQALAMAFEAADENTEKRRNSRSNGGKSKNQKPKEIEIYIPPPTPGLTMEPNTPQSSGPPSTGASATEEPAVDSPIKSSAVGASTEAHIGAA